MDRCANMRITINKFCTNKSDWKPFNKPRTKKIIFCYFFFPAASKIHLLKHEIKFMTKFDIVFKIHTVSQLV